MASSQVFAHPPQARPSHVLVQGRNAFREQLQELKQDREDGLLPEATYQRAVDALLSQRYGVAAPELSASQATVPQSGRVSTDRQHDVVAAEDAQRGFLSGFDDDDDGVQHQRLWFSPHEFITDPTKTLTL